MAAFTEAGEAHDITFATHLCSFPCFGNATCNQGTVPLAPNQINHVTVCQRNGLCPAGGCVTVDVSGNPLEIVQVLPTPRAIPVVASPGTPAGIALVGLLLAAMGWLLRRSRV